MDITIINIREMENNKVMQLVIDGLKIPCSPTFVTARDAIIAADQATTGKIIV
jgi:hypothetical protein